MAKEQNIKARTEESADIQSKAAYIAGIINFTVYALEDDKDFKSLPKEISNGVMNCLYEAEDIIEKMNDLLEEHLREAI